MQIDVDFDVWKALTARRDREDVSYNDVLRQLLGLSGPAPAQVSEQSINREAPRDFQSRQLVLPHGTMLRASYKGRSYTARIENGRWIDEHGVEHRSPSAAARHITGTSVNGLRFWQGKRPDMKDWFHLDGLALI